MFKMCKSGSEGRLEVSPMPRTTDCLTKKRAAARLEFSVGAAPRASVATGEQWSGMRLTRSTVPACLHVKSSRAICGATKTYQREERAAEVSSRKKQRSGTTSGAEYKIGGHLLAGLVLLPIQTPSE